MIELLQNTIELIGNLSLSSSGYLLKVNGKFSETIAFFGYDEEAYTEFNLEFTRQIAKSYELQPSEVMEFKTYKELAASLSIESVFFKEIFVPKSGEYSVFLFMYSGRAENYDDKTLKSVAGIFDTLYDQLCALEDSIKPAVPGTAKEVVEKDEKQVPAALPVEPGKLLDFIFNTSEDLIFILSGSGVFIDVNPGGALMLDFTPEELTGKLFLDYVEFKERAKVTRSLQDIFRTGTLHSFTCTMVSASNKEKILQIKAGILKTGDSSPGIIGIAKDISRQKHYEQSLQELNYKVIETNRLLSIERGRSNQKKSILEELNNLKGEFVSSVSHELRTPLASIIGFSETIASDPEMPLEMRNEFNQIILNEGKRLAKLINDILDLSRMESGGIEINRTEFDVVKLLKDILDSYQKTSLEKNIAIRYELPPDEVTLHADKERIGQLFHELISNAFKFTKSGGKIAVIAQSLFREFEVIISDTGHGIPEKDLPYIFQKFYKVNRPGSETPGTGLGLVFVKQIVDLHKGLVSVQSSPDKGTSFQVKLPKSFKVQKK